MAVALAQARILVRALGERVTRAPRPRSPSRW
jgi:hypothetical protein